MAILSAGGTEAQATLLGSDFHSSPHTRCETWKNAEWLKGSSKSKMRGCRASNFQSVRLAAPPIHLHSMRTGLANN
jgi:hypothetical protein